MKTPMFAMSTNNKIIKPFNISQLSPLSLSFAIQGDTASRRYRLVSN